jgi:hypothetical protein
VEFQRQTSQSQSMLLEHHENEDISRVIDILREIPHPDFFSKITIGKFIVAEKF